MDIATHTDVLAHNRRLKFDINVFKLFRSERSLSAYFNGAEARERTSIMTFKI